MIRSAAVLTLLLAAPAVAADAERGRTLFAEHDCKSCHPQENAPLPFGPSLCGIIGRAAATYRRYPRFSDALKASGIVWTRDRLEGFLTFPLSYVRGTRMGYSGLEDKADLADVIAYLERENTGELCQWDRLTPAN